MLIVKKIIIIILINVVNIICEVFDSDSSSTYRHLFGDGNFMDIDLVSLTNFTATKIIAYDGKGFLVDSRSTELK